MILRAIFKQYLSSAWKYIPFYNSTYPGSIYLIEVNDPNIDQRVKSVQSQQ